MCEKQAVKQILADRIKAAMEKDRLTKAAMAIRMQTSRRALHRLLDPTNGYRPPTPAGTYLKRRTPLTHFPPEFPQSFQLFRSLRPVSPILACYTRIRRRQCSIPSIPSAPSTSVTTRVTHLAKKCPQMRHKISPHHLNSLKRNRLKPHDYEFHIPGTDASPGWPAWPVRESRPPAPGPR